MPYTQSQGFDGTVLYRRTFILNAIRMHCKFHTAYMWINRTIHPECSIKDVNPIHCLFQQFCATLIHVLNMQILGKTTINFAVKSMFCNWYQDVQSWHSILATKIWNLTMLKTTELLYYAWDTLTCCSLIRCKDHSKYDHTYKAHTSLHIIVSFLKSVVYNNTVMSYTSRPMSHARH